MASDLTIASVRPRQIYELMGSLPPEGRSWRYTRQRMQEFEAEGRLVLRAGGRPFLKRYMADAAGVAAPSPDEVAQLPPFAAFIREFSADLARRLALRPGDLKDLEWRDLERALAEACEGLGFQTRLTRPAKDGGFDIELVAAGETYLVEVKHWSAPSRVGSPEVTQFAEIVVSRAAARGLLLSTSGFRSAVMAERLEVAPQRVALGNGQKIIGLCQRYLETTQGMWWPQTQLPEVLFLDTF
ncbi:restriction endonuclease [Caulobacter sp.]|jgi:hypothetical protein|uniref:restriction endonuclease n=1 Tax=Caulobacter sp. TaxID=78 RepID=UPI0031DF9049